MLQLLSPNKLNPCHVIQYILSVCCMWTLDYDLKLFNLCFFSCNPTIYQTSTTRYFSFWTHYIPVLPVQTWRRERCIVGFASPGVAVLCETTAWITACCEMTACVGPDWIWSPAVWGCLKHESCWGLKVAPSLTHSHMHNLATLHLSHSQTHFVAKGEGGSRVATSPTS